MARAFWQDMNALCMRVGTNGHYNCAFNAKTGRFETPDHWLPINASLFETQPELRAEIGKAVEHARAIGELRAMGAMEPANRPGGRAGA